jgi:hypothetical protein
LFRQFADALELGEFSKEKIIADMRQLALMQEQKARECEGQAEPISALHKGEQKMQTEAERRAEFAEASRLLKGALSQIAERNMKLGAVLYALCTSLISVAQEANISLEDSIGALTECWREANS